MVTPDVENRSWSSAGVWRPRSWGRWPRRGSCPTGRASRSTVMASTSCRSPAPSAIALGVADRTWVLPRDAGCGSRRACPTASSRSAPAEMITLWFEPERCPVRWDRPTVVDADELLLALVDRLLDESLTTAERTRSERVLFDVLRPVAGRPARPRAAVRRPGPPGGRGGPDRPGRRPHALGRGAAPSAPASARSCGRSGPETGVGFQEWRTRARMAAALRLLLTDTPVSAIAPAVGLRDHERVQCRLPAHDGRAAVSVPGCLTSPAVRRGRRRRGGRSEQ